MHIQPGGGEKIRYSRSPVQGLACSAKLAPREFREELNDPAGLFSNYHEKVML